MKNPADKKSKLPSDSLKGYDSVLSSLVSLLESARRTSSRTINAIMTATYWEIGRRIVEFEQGGDICAEYKAGLLGRLSKDLTSRFGRGFSVDNLETMRLFYSAYPPERISETLSWKSGAPPSSTSKSETPSRKFNLSDLSGAAAMNTPSPLVSLGEILAPVNRPEAIDPEKTYHILGAHWYGKGLYTKDIRSGSEIQAKNL